MSQIEVDGTTRYKPTIVKVDGPTCQYFNAYICIYFIVDTFRSERPLTKFWTKNDWLTAQIPEKIFIINDGTIIIWWIDEIAHKPAA